jgi:hypothetical protein
MKAFFGYASWDIAGMAVSVLCIMHCIAVPVLLSFTVFSSLAFLRDPSTEYAILIASALLGTGSLLPSYFRHHRKLAAIYILLAGFLLIGLGRFNVTDVYEVVLTSAGAVAVASAHFCNWRLCRNHCIDEKQ